MVLLHHLKPEVIQVVRKLILEDFKLEDYMEIFNKEIDRGLSIETTGTAKVKTIITHINKVPTGKEEGQFLGLDFSGPVLKIMLVKLENRESTVTRKMYDIPEKLMNKTAEKLFDFIAQSLADFVSGLKLKMLRIPLGVTFGFPIEQSSLQNCKLLRWAKGFQCHDIVGKNVFVKFMDSIRKFPELKRLYLIGILNDAVSAVLALAWQDPTCLIGVVVGPGFSCCYAEKVSRISKYEAESYAIRDMYINLESSGLGEDGCLEYVLTEFDQELDQKSKRPGKQINEKMISTVYFGELAKLVILKCIESNLILNGEITDKLLARNSFTIDHMARIEKDPDTDHTNCREVLSEFGYSATDEDCFQVQFICRCISRRSANLVAAQLATIINRINVPFVTIAADGDLIKNYPNFKWYLTRKLGQLKKENCDFQIKETDENGVGPAVLAAVFGEEVMDRDEKLRRLPGFPMDKCHFGKQGKCLNPDCNANNFADTSKVNPQQPPKTAVATASQDLLSTGKKDFNCDALILTTTQRSATATKQQYIPPPEGVPYKKKKKECTNACRGYSRM